MRILFINKFLDRDTIYRVPLGILYLSSAIKKAKYRHEVFICEPQRENVFAKLRDLKPDIVGYSVRTGFHQYYIDLNKRLKKQFDFLSIFGGPHATFFPEMIEEEGVDCIARGECESAIVDLLDRLEKKQSYFETGNFWFKTEGQIFRNPVRELEQDLDKIAFPDRKLLDNFKEIRFSKVHNFITTRGCPFNCSYCFNHSFKQMYQGQRYVRKRNVDNIIKEIEGVASDYPLTRVHFEDDNFITDKPWLEEFASKYPKIPFKCAVRANLVNEEIIGLLKTAGCLSVSFAIEAGNDRIRNEILNRQMTKEQIINCARLLKKYKIKFLTQNILASPTSTLADDIETLDLNLECQPDYPIVSLLQPYPRTEIFRIALESGQFAEKDIEKMRSFYDVSPLKITQKMERVNLQRIFALIVALPFLRKYLNFLISQRKLYFLYSFLYYLWRPYCLVFKIMPHKLSLREYYWLLKRYLNK